MKKILSLALIVTLILTLTACADAAEKKPKVKFNKKQLKKIELVESPRHGSPMIVLRENYSDVPIMGEPVATQDQMVNYINKRNPAPKLNCTVKQLVHLYYVEGGREGRKRAFSATAATLSPNKIIIADWARPAAASKARSSTHRNWAFARTFNTCCPTRRNVRPASKSSTRATS